MPFVREVGLSKPEKDNSECVKRESQHWNIGNGREPIFGMEYDIPAPGRKRAGRLHHFGVLTLLFVFIYLWPWSNAPWTMPRDVSYTLAPPITGVMDDRTVVFDWNNRLPSKELNWTDCFDRFQCARLSVPLLYSEPSGDEAAVALIKSPSRYPPGHEKYRGPILFNPGGPGGSGVDLILELEQAFRIILGDEFDLIGFDPRGVGFTTPKLSIFHDQVEAGIFNSQITINLNASTSSLGEAYSRAKILSDLVADRAGFVAERVSTPIVARDMLSIVRAFGQEKLQYWGFSYGTVLGATFASMFPNNVGRILIDGVVDSQDYYSGSWANNLRDTDAALMDIYRACVDAGPLHCPIYERTADLVKARVDKLLDRLRIVPLAYYNNPSSSISDYDIVDYSLVKQVIFQVLYRTHTRGALLTNALAAIERGNTSQIYQLSFKAMFNSLVQCSCPAPGETPQIPGMWDVAYTIGCGDVLSDGVEDLESVREAYGKMAEMSSFADTWGPRVSCSSWKLRGKERFNGSFEQATSHPLLLIGNTADPVTPLWNAHKMSKGFKNSVVLTQNSSGHCSIAATSICTFRAVREYFVNGTLPERGTVCETQSSIFGEKEVELQALSREDEELMAAAEMLQKNYFIGNMWDSSNV